jgi:hypothetical protein
MWTIRGRGSLEQRSAVRPGDAEHQAMKQVSEQNTMTVMETGRPALALAMFAVAVIGNAALGAEKFQRLAGAQIRAKFVGMEMTDNVHWADVFGSNGDLKTYSMGRKKDGKWRVERDELCVDRGKDDGGCYQVWLSGRNVELRREGLPAALEGTLQRPALRN